jgi:protoheme IX farnesyltransferase
MQNILELPADASTLAALDAVDPIRSSDGSRLNDFYELTKPRMNFLVLATTLFGFRMATAGAIHWPLLLSTAIGTLLTASSASVLNQLIERRFDGLMKRTRNRPLPAGRVAPRDALIYGLLLGISGVVYLALLVNPLTAGLGLITILWYLLLYTPSKRFTTLNTVIGAVPGAIPPMMGVAAAQNAITPEALGLFGILFLWQMPHFLAIAILYRQDYAAGGFRMLPCDESNRSFTNRQIILYSIALIPVSLLPAMLGMTTPTYIPVAILLGMAFLAFGIITASSAPADHRASARKLFFASIIYLPLLFTAMTLYRV